MSIRNIRDAQPKPGRPVLVEDGQLVHLKLPRALLLVLDAWVAELQQGVAGKAINRAALVRDILERAAADHVRAIARTSGKAAPPKLPSKKRAR